jgi:hypothetical protein
VRLRGAQATAALSLAISSGAATTSGGTDGDCSLTFSANAPAAFCPLAFALRAPLPGCFGVVDTLRAFFDDPSLRRYIVAAAYIDDAGAALAHPGGDCQGGTCDRHRTGPRLARARP